MAKIKNSVWSIFAQGTKMYFINLPSFLKYLAFPVLGQILGVFLMLVASFFYAQNLPALIIKGGLLDNFSMIFLILILLILPGLLVFAKAFWDYLVAYGAINSMVDNMLKSGRIYDFPAHTELITRRITGFVGVWLLFGIFTALALFPLLWVVGFVFFVYFVLIFQVFTFEPDKSPIGCFKKSYDLIKGNFWRTLGLIFLVGTLSCSILPSIVKALFDFINLIAFFAVPIEVWAKTLPLSEINHLILTTPLAYQITPIWLATYIVGFFVTYVVTCFTLPLRSICWALWYKNLNKGEVKLDKKILKRAEAKD